MIKWMVIIIASSLWFGSWISVSAGERKIRLIVLTDIENEPDDAQSMVRLMTYANEFEIEGLIATTSCWLRNKTAAWRIHEIVEAYGKVRNNLLIHASGYPERDYLKARIKTGLPEYGMSGVGEGKDSEGSDWIIQIVDEEDVQPVWITVWGGANCLAQTLWKVRETRNVLGLAEFVSKIRVYTISDQDDSGPWIREQFPDLFYIVSPGFEQNSNGAYSHATWNGISGDKFHGRFRGPDFSIVDNPWLDEHIRQNHGPLGAQHPHTEYLMEGDTPSFLYLIPNGLGDPEHPDWGSWGGRYELYTPHKKLYHLQAETRPIWTNAVDEVHAPDGFDYTSNQATIWRWREAYQHDFAARIDWSNTLRFEDANHPPLPALSHTDRISVKSGENVKLDATNSSDPDGDTLSYQWIYYKEAGTYGGCFRLETDDRIQTSFIAPSVLESKTVHIILKVQDDGIPSLTRYQRVIVTVTP